MTTQNKQARSDVRNKKIEKSYGSNYLKWKEWNNNTFFGEIGFGNGSFLKFAKEKNWKIYGTEINKNLVKKAIECGYNVTHTDNLLSYKDNTFDLVVAFDVMEHIPQDEVLNFISQVKRTLKKDGFFIARVPNGDSPFGLVNQNGDITHLTTIGSGKIFYFAALSNMEVIFVGEEAQPLIGTSLLFLGHRLIALPIKKILNLITRLIFFPRSNIAFYSLNLTMIYRKSKPSK